jgi:hypothetical protein
MIIAPNAFHVKKHPVVNTTRVTRIKNFLTGKYKPTGLMDLYYDKPNGKEVA